MKSVAFRTIILVAIFSLISGCSAVTRSSNAVKISSVRPAPAGIEERHRVIRRTDYVKALEGSRGVANIRVIPMVVSAAQAPATPEYRIFNVRKGSVGDLLGLEDSDVLVAAHDYVVKDQAQFYGYLQAVLSEKRSQIEIRRKQKPILLTFEFSED